MLEAVHKRRPQSGWRGVCPVRTFCGQGWRGFFRCGRPHFLVQKTSDFSKFMVYPHGQGRLSQCGHFAVKGGQFFANLCGHVLWTAPYIIRACFVVWKKITPRIMMQVCIGSTVYSSIFSVLLATISTLDA